MGNCSITKNTKHDDYHGGVQKKANDEPRGSQSKKSLKRSRSFREGTQLSTKSKESLDEVVKSKRESSNVRNTRPSKKGSWLSSKKGTAELMDPVNVLFLECKKDAVAIGTLL